MSKTKQKEVALYNIDSIIELHNQLSERGEILDSIHFEDQENFKFNKGTLFLFARLSKVKSFNTTSRNEDKTIKRRYIPDSEYPIDLEDFKVRKEETFYK